MPNLTALLAEYGMGARDGIVIENDQNRFLSGYPYYLLPNIKSHDVTQPLVDSGSYVLAPLAHAITVLDEMPENVSVDALLATVQMPDDCLTDWFRIVTDDLDLHFRASKEQYFVQHCCVGHDKNHSI